MEMDKKLLPIGSVVQLADSTALVMVTGYLPVRPSEPGRLWDYSGFKFPLGYTDDDQIYCFNEDQVQIVYAYGYRDIEYEIFMSRLKESLEKMSGQSENS